MKDLLIELGNIIWFVIKVCIGVFISAIPLFITILSHNNIYLLGLFIFIPIGVLYLSKVCEE